MTMPTAATHPRRAAFGPRALGPVLLAAMMLVLALPAGANAGILFGKHQRIAGDAFSSAAAAMNPEGRLAVNAYRHASGPGDLFSRQVSSAGQLGPLVPVEAELSKFSEVTLDPEGRATVAWRKSVDFYKTYVFVRSIGPDGTAGPIRAISPADNVADQVALAAAPQGHVFVVWVIDDVSSFNRQWIQVRTLDSTGAPAGPIRTISATDRNVRTPTVAVDSSGNAIVAWVYETHPRVTIEARRIAPNGNPLGSIQNVAESGTSAQRPLVAFGGDGRATVAWEEHLSDRDRIKARRLATDGTPSGTVQTVSDPELPIWDHDLGVDDAGRTTIVWQRGSGGAAAMRRLAPDGTPLGPAVALDRGSWGGLYGVGASKVAVHPGGRATAVWQAADDTSGEHRTRVWARHIGAGGQLLGPLIRLDPRKILGDCSNPKVEVDGRGRVTVVSTCQDGVYYVRGAIAPYVSITKGPKGKTKKRRAKFAFVADEAGTSFACKLDKSKWRTCNSPARYGKLKRGKHGFRVRGTTNGVAGPIAKRAWRVK